MDHCDIKKVRYQKEEKMKVYYGKILVLPVK